MKLTNYLRDGFVRAVRNDMPAPTPWPKLKDLQVMVYEAMPPALKTVYDNEELRPALKTESYYKPESYSDRGQVIVGNLKLDTFYAPIYKEVEQKNAAIEKVRVVAYSCSTLKQLQDALPELIEYMPSETKTTTKNLPMITGVISALKDAGFPKE